MLLRELMSVGEGAGVDDAVWAENVDTPSRAEDDVFGAQLIYRIGDVGSEFLGIGSQNLIGGVGVTRKELKIRGSVGAHPQPIRHGCCNLGDDTRGRELAAKVGGIETAAAG